MSLSHILIQLLASDYHHYNNLDAPIFPSSTYVRVLRTCRAEGSHQWCLAPAPLMRRTKHDLIAYQKGFKLLIETSYTTQTY